jgi:hypothetical protein
MWLAGEKKNVANPTPGEGTDGDSLGPLSVATHDRDCAPAGVDTAATAPANSAARTNDLITFMGRFSNGW